MSDEEDFQYPPPPTEDDEEEEEDEPEDVETTTTADPLEGPVSPSLCKQGLFERLDDLLNLIASGWRYHISSTDGVKESWLRFDNATNKICAMMAGAWGDSLFLSRCLLRGYGPLEGLI